MTPQDYERMWLLFEEAKQKPPTEREAFLEGHCSGNAELCREVGRLLAQAEATLPKFLARPILGDIAFPPPAPAYDPLIGQRVGPYQLQRQIGSGGMGVVYLARRVEDYEQRVAVKLIRHGLQSEQALRRFQDERQVLAALSHPHIARLLDGGNLDGQPYLVMEYIEGQPIDEYCRTRHLTIAERVELFRAVCTAVQYAHQNLVLHRDLKPGNVLVAADGAPKLLDFGIAKLLNPQAWGRAAEATASGGPPLTPEYASPEQIRGGEVLTTASDVYALGVVLYGLLTEHRPHEAAGRSAYELARSVCEDEPPPLRRWRPDLPRDLEAICLKCLHKDPHQRYDSALALAEDLQRWLAGAPVLARRTGPWKRGLKWTRRHPAFAALTVVCLGAALALLGVWAAFTAELGRAKTRAEQTAAAEKQQRELAQNRLREVFREADTFYENVRGLWVFADIEDDDRLQDLLRTALVANQRLAEHLETHGQPFNLGMTCLRRAELTHALGKPTESLTLIRRARESFEGLPVGQRQKPEVRLCLSSVYNILARLYDENGLGPEAEAEAHHLTSIALADSLVKEFKTVPTYQFELSDRYAWLGQFYRQRGRKDQAETYFRKAVAVQEKWIQPSKKEMLMGTLLGAYHQLCLANLLHEGGKPEALAWYGQSFDAFQQVLRHRPNSTKARRGLAEVFKAKAKLALQLGLFEAHASAAELWTTGFQSQPAALWVLLAFASRQQRLRDLNNRAVQDCNRALALEQTHHRASWRVPASSLAFRAVVLAHTGQHQSAVALAQALDERFPWTGEGSIRVSKDLQPPFEVWPMARDQEVGDTCCLLARAFAVSATAVGRDAALPMADRERRAEEYLARAVKLLKRADEKGYFANRLHASILREDRDFQALRARADFQDLVQKRQR
jgi:serine/threonine-protein kinase